MTTIDQLTRSLADRRAAAERRLRAVEAAGHGMLDAARREGRSHLSAGESPVVEHLIRQADEARAELADIDRQMPGFTAAAADERVWAAAAAQSHPTGAAAPPSAPGTVPLGTDTRGTPLPGPQWVRHADGRPGVVERGQRFADNEVAAAEIHRSSGRDQAVIGMHGGLGSLVRSMSTTSGSAVVPTIWAADIIDRARNLATVMQAGAQVVPMDAKIVQIGRLTADPAATFRAEGSSITASDPTFDNVTLTATTLNALVIGSLEWFQDVTPGGGADQLVSEAIAKVIALQIDLAALYGQVTAGAEQTATGNNMLPSGGLPSPNPRGILANLLANASSSVLGGATNGTVQTATSFWNEVIDTIMTPLDFNEQPNAMLWPSHLARRYAEQYDSQNNPLRVPPVVDAMRKFVTNQIPSGFTQGTGTLMADLFAGDFNQLLIGQRLDLTIQTLTERYAELGQVGILATWRGDIQLARPRAFAVYRYLQGK